MLHLKRTDSSDDDFKDLVRKLDAFLAVTDGEDHAFYDQFNKIDKIKYVVVAYEGDEPIACGAIKAYDEHSMEVKRMFTSESCRGKGVAGQVLSDLEAWTQELGYSKCILETGIRQTAAIRLYEKNGYALIPNYGQYADVEDSRCFEKVI